MTTPRRNPGSPELPRLQWTPWVPLGSRELAIEPGAVGLYRIRRAAQRDAMYVGQTGRCLRGRVAALARQVAGEEMPWNDPHTAAPALWAWRRDTASPYEVSVAALDGDRPVRLAMECWLVWLHRVEHGYSPAANFGRMPTGWTKSANRSSGRRGQMDGAARPAPCAAPLPGSGEPTGLDWMGLQWTQWYPLDHHGRASGPGLYRLRQGIGPSLAYVGETGSLKTRLGEHVRRLHGLGPVSVSVATVGQDVSRTERLEWENDLIAHHFATTGSPPTLQFGATSAMRRPPAPASRTKATTGAVPLPPT